MKCRVIRGDGKSGIPVTDMEDGDVAEIVQWETDPLVVGKAVQRCGNTLTPIGEDSSFSWTCVFTGRLHSDCRVRLLQRGDTIVFE